MVLFDDEAAKKMDEHISQLVRKITRLIKNSEQKLKDLLAESMKNLEDSDSTMTETDGNEKSKRVSRVKEEVINNIRQSYLMKLQSFTR